MLSNRDAETKARGMPTPFAKAEARSPFFHLSQLTRRSMWNVDCTDDVSLPP